MNKVPSWRVGGLWGAPVVAQERKDLCVAGSGGGAEGGPGGLAGDDVLPVVGGEAVEATVCGCVVAQDGGAPGAHEDILP